MSSDEQARLSQARHSQDGAQPRQPYVRGASTPLVSGPSPAGSHMGRPAHQAVPQPRTQMAPGRAQAPAPASPVSPAPSPAAGRRRAAGTASARPGVARHAASRTEGADAYVARRKRKGRGRVLKAVLCSLLVVLVGASAAVAAYVGDINSRLGAGVSDDLREQLVSVEPQDPFYMLLLGVDKSQDRAEGWGDSSSNFRSDTIILCRVDPPAQKVTLVSIPRDTMVPMEGHGTQKINSAYSFGGAPYVVKVVSKFAGVDIAHYAEVDFEQLTSIVDSIGGIEVNLPVPVVDEKYAHINLPAGVQTIDGTQALGLCRSRHAYDEYGGGDFFRAANQRMVIASIVKKVLTLDPVSMSGTVSSLANSVATDLSVQDILGLAMQFKNLDTDNSIYSGQVPTVSEYTGGVWMENVDKSAWATMMERVKQGLPPYADSSEDFTAGVAGSVGNGVTGDGGSGAAAPAQPSFTGSVQVLNATKVNGLAGSKVTVLTNKGFSAVAENSSNKDGSPTKVYYNEARPGAQASALGVAQTLGVDDGNVAKNDGTYSDGFDVIVVLGPDQSK